jgi:YD repeat-containing protein
MYLNFTLKYKTKASTRQKKGGGLRVHSITTLDSGNFAKKKTFQYDINETSTGRLVSPLKYFYNETLVNESVIPIPGNVIHYIYTADYLVRNSSSVIPLGNSAQGNAIGYDKVTIYNTDDEGVNLGRTEYFYRNEEEIPNENFLPGVPSFIHLNNGQLLSEISYNSQNKIVSIRDLKYEENQDVQISSKSVKLYSFFGSNSIGGVRFYDTFSKWWYLSEEHQTVYDEQGNAPITTKTYYEYNNEIHKNITRTTQTNSKNETLTVNRYYPDDIDHRTFLSGLEDSEYSALQRLKHGHAEHRINTLIQEESFVDNVLTSIQRTNFKTVNNVTLPKSIATGINTTTLEKRIHYYSYDSNGNPLEISKDQGPHIVYLWGYNETYPVAKIENATLAQVQSKLTNSELSNIRQGIYNTPALQTVLNKIRTGLPSAMVSTYTYDPLVGMISMTDPRGYTTYYEYDKFNRLSKVKDADGHIVNCNQYHYKE